MIVNKNLRICIAQLNFTVGDIIGNEKKIIGTINKVEREGCDVVVFPELTITGYPPDDLLLKTKFIEDNLLSLKRIAKNTVNTVAMVGFVDIDDDIYNAAAVISEGKIKGIYRKRFLPSYGVFNENRYFKSGYTSGLFLIKGVKIGINIGEDIWYPDGPGWLQSLNGASVIVNLSASPYCTGKVDFRKRMVSTRASDYATFIFYANLVGGQDELVFDGGSMVFDQEGKLIAKAKMFEEDFLITDVNIGFVMKRTLYEPRRRKKYVERTLEITKISDYKLTHNRKKMRRIEPNLSLEEQILRALIVGTKDYVRKNGFKKVIIGLSGGIDSSLVAVISTMALGNKNVKGVIMPSRFTSNQSIVDAEKIAKNLGMEIINIDIDSIFEQYLKSLKREFKNKKWDNTEENIQARIRGNILMALSNKYGYLVLTTGNKSEISVGYATLYGDMAGGFAVIKDLFKTEVYKLSYYINKREGKEIIPLSIINKPPSAELKENQKDEDTLGPYSELDYILREYIEGLKDYKEIVVLGYSDDSIKKIIEMVDRSEYKRRQSPLGIRITSHFFGKERKLPVTNKYKGSI